MSRIRIFCILVELFFLSRRLYAVNNFTSIPDSVAGIISVCPGNTVSITCSHDNVAGDLTRWDITGAASTCFIGHDPPDNGAMCGSFVFSGVSDSTSAMTTNLTSSAQATATTDMDGTVVTCRSGAGTSSAGLVGNITITVLRIPTPTITLVDQISQYMVRVNMSVTDPQCVGSYQANTTQAVVAGSIAGPNSISPSVVVSGLDVCLNSYSFVGYVITAGGVAGELSSPYNFTTDLSVVNGVVNVRTNQERTALEWIQENNDVPNYSTCIANYSIEWNGMTYNTVDTATSVSREELTGFPFCSMVSVTVTPITPVGPLTGTTSNVTIVHPDFVEPSISGVYTLDPMNTERIVFMGTVQNISNSVVQDRMFGVSRVGMNCIPNTMFTDGSFEAPLPDNDTFRETFTICVEFTNDECMKVAAVNFTVPGSNITMPDEGTVTDTSYTVPLDLPVSVYRPEELFIISSVFPNDIDPVTANFSSSYQYTLTFSGLNPGVDYNYTVKIIVRSNMTIEVATAVGAFSTAPLPTTMATISRTNPTTAPTTTTPTQPTDAPLESGGCNTNCIIAIVVVVVVVLLLLLLAIVIIIVVRKCLKTGKVDFKKSGEVEMDQHTLTGASTGVEESKPSGMDSPTSDSLKNSEARNQSPAPDDSKTDLMVGAGTTGSSGPENLIYADLDLATKGKKHKPQDAPSPTGGAGKDEDVQYATITTTVNKEEP